jgi:transcriptional regulator with XRE-family HTH domain
MGIGSKLKRLRGETKYSQRDIADILGVDKNTYANWESEQNDIKSEHIPKLAEIFDVEIKDLFEARNNVEINFNKQVHKGSSTNNSVVIVMPDKESVEKLIGILSQRLDL